MSHCGYRDSALRQYGEGPREAKVTLISCEEKHHHHRGYEEGNPFSRPLSICLNPDDTMAIKILVALSPRFLRVIFDGIIFFLKHPIYLDILEY